MKTIVFAMAVAVALAADKYSNAFENVDIDKVLENDRLVQNYADCILDHGTCSPEVAALKEVLPEIFKTDCAKCSKIQKEKGKKLVVFLMEKKPDLWKQVADKYDPDGTFRKNFKKN